MVIDMLFNYHMMVPSVSNISSWQALARRTFGVTVTLWQIVMTIIMSFMRLTLQFTFAVIS